MKTNDPKRINFEKGTATYYEDQPEQATGVTRLSGALNDVLLEYQRRFSPGGGGLITTPRHALVKACAVILAEIERMDRLA